MRVETQLSAFLENKAGTLAALAADLGRHAVNIRALTIANLTDHAVVRFVVSDPQKALHLLGERGVLVVASAGNKQDGQSPDDVATPASIELVIGVGAVDQSKAVADFSLRGSQTNNEGPFGTGLGGSSPAPA